MPQLFLRPRYVWFPIHLKGPMIPDPSGQLAELIVYITSTRVDLYSHQILLRAIRPFENNIYRHCADFKNIWPRYHQLDASSPSAACGETNFAGQSSIVREYQMCACEVLFDDIWLCPSWVNAIFGSPLLPRLKLLQFAPMALKPQCMSIIYVETDNNVREG